MRVRVQENRVVHPAGASVRRDYAVVEVFQETGFVPGGWFLPEQGVKM